MSHAQPEAAGGSDPLKKSIEAIQQEVRKLEGEIKEVRKKKRIWPTIVMTAITAAGVTAAGTVPEMIRAREASHVALVAQQQAEATRDRTQHEADLKAAASFDFQQQFFNSYRDHLATLGAAARSYQEKPTPELEQRLRLEVEAFVGFIDRWRRFNVLMATILDGNVTRLQNAAKVWNPRDIYQAHELLLRGLGDTEPLIRAALASLSQPGKPPTGAVSD